MSIRFFNVFQSIQRLMSHPTQEYCFLTLKCKMSTKAGASRSDIDIITWERTSCIHYKPCNITMSFYLNGSVYKKKKKNNRILLKENLTDRNQLTF